jgi:hypothetical protein
MRLRRIADLSVRYDSLPMKAFWFTYILATVALLGFCCWCLFGFQPVLCGMLSAGTVLSAGLVVRKRRILSRQNHLVSVAVVAGFASVAVGFVAIFLLTAAGSIFH